MKVIETYGAALGSFIIIVDENGNQETVELTRFATKKNFCQQCDTDKQYIKKVSLLKQFKNEKNNIILLGNIIGCSS